jgi:hypothetical protein
MTGEDAQLYQLFLCWANKACVNGESVSQQNLPVLMQHVSDIFVCRIGYQLI